MHYHIGTYNYHYSHTYINQITYITLNDTSPSNHPPIWDRRTFVPNSFKFINAMSSKEPNLFNFLMSCEWLHGWKINNKHKMLWSFYCTIYLVTNAYNHLNNEFLSFNKLVFLKPRTQNWMVFHWVLQGIYCIWLAIRIYTVK